MKLARFRPNRVRPDEDPELVSSRNFDGLSATLEKAFGTIEGDSSNVAKQLARKANATNPVVRGLLTILGGIADLSILSVTGNITLTSGNGTVEADATGGSLTITLPPAASSKGLLFQIFKVDTSTNTVTIDGNASETIDGALTIVIGGNVGNSRLFIYCNGSNWRIRELYEEGTYVPTLTCDTSGTITLGPANQLAYTKIGKQVTVSGKMGVASVSSPVGAVLLSLPFACRANSSGSVRDGIAIGLLQIGQAPSLNEYLQTSAGIATAAILYNNAGTITVYPAANFSGDEELYINLTYFSS